MHGLPEWTQVSIFYNSVNTPTRMMLDASANGTLLDKPPRESLEILDILAQNDYQHPTSRRGITKRGPAQLDSSDTILAHISALTNIVKNMQKQPNIQEVKALDAFCELCGNNHDASECGQTLESSWPIGGFPSDNEVAKCATHEQCKAITTRNGRVLKPTIYQKGTTANSSATTDEPTEADEPAETSEDHDDPHITSKGESSAESAHTRTDKSEEVKTPPPFPQTLKKQKQDYQFKKFFDILKQVHINLPLVEALQQMPNYAKFLKDMVSSKKRIEEFETAAATETCLALMYNKVPANKADPGSFTIECSIGHNYSTKALCDPGASINLMPKSVFKKFGIGEAKPITVVLQLADHSFVQPEGRIEDILVQIDKFNFPPAS
ncbi:hypothetical protein V6N13_034084 [Hibiscus sabdariffa]